MFNYIILLPQELQSKILDEIPEFTRLSKNNVSGKNHLQSLYSKSISSDEFQKYIKNHKPDRYFYYYKYDNRFVIVENFWEFGYYRSIGHYYNYCNDKITIQILNINNDDNHYYKNGKVQYDLNTVYNIYKYYRKEYVDINKIILNYFNENLIKYQTDDDFTNKIIRSNYIYSNNLNINDQKRLSVLTTRLSHMLKNDKSDTYKEIISSFIDNIYSGILPEIYSYIENLNKNKNKK
jgi:hypothetical protein